MKKVIGVMILVFSLSGIGLGAVQELKSEDGKFSGSASLDLVAKGTIIARIPQEKLVLEVKDEEERSGDVINFTHNGISSEEVRESKKKVVAQIYREDESGKMQLADFNKSVETKIINVNGDEGIERTLKDIDGVEIGKISYSLGDGKKLKKGFEKEITNKVVIDHQDKGGIFIDKDSSLKVVIKDLAMVY